MYIRQRGVFTFEDAIKCNRVGVYVVNTILTLSTDTRM